MSWFTQPVRRTEEGRPVEGGVQRTTSAQQRTPAGFARVVLTQSYAKDVGFCPPGKGLWWRSHFLTAPAAG